MSELVNDVSIDSGFHSSQQKLLQVINAGFSRLPNIYPGLDHTMNMPPGLPVVPWRQWLNFIVPSQSVPEEPSVRLDPLLVIQQESEVDCVGAVSMSVLSEITGVPITPKLYGEVLESALRHKLAVQEEEGIHVMPFVLNVVLTPEFKDTYPNKVSVEFRKKLSLPELSEMVKKTRRRGRISKLFVLSPVESWLRAETGHLVAIQEIKSCEVTIFDPHYKELQEVPTSEFLIHWDFDERSAILVAVSK